MITNEGRKVIKRVFSGQLPQIAGAMVFGTGTTAASLTDTQLVEEVIRVSISSIGADLENNRIVFKAVLQPGSISSFTEVGLYSSSNAVVNIMDGTNVLVARTVLSEATVLDADVPSEIEYALEIDIS